MGIDLNTIEEEEEEESMVCQEEQRPPAVSAGGVCLELWHACAGPRISLPRKGSLVVYLPQGHLEHVASVKGGAGGGGMLLRCDLSPHLVCRVVDVQLRADASTDGVYTQLSLLAEGEAIDKQIQEEGVENVGDEVDEMDSRGKSAIPHMFCKTLTASDTSTHGGFSVPRRAAEDCFPQLDYRQQRPSQELVAKDLHGVEWRFKHIYRGQPRRHLLTTGWSGFVNKKKLVSGDAVLFIRGEDGELRLGIRRASQLMGSNSFAMPPNQCLNIGVGFLASIANAVSSKSTFQINYNPRANQSEFIIPYWKFTKSCRYSISVGDRFKMRIEGEDTAERRYTGLIAAVCEVDPIRWSRSKWRCLAVRWDDDDVMENCRRPNRLSPWEIELIGSSSSPSNLIMSGSKRSRNSFSSGIIADSSHPIGGGGFESLGEPMGFHKVLQGQEILGFKQSYKEGSNSCLVPGLESSNFVYKSVGLAESMRFHKVLQGQEIIPVLPSYRATAVEQRGESNGFKPFEPCIPLQGFCAFVPPRSSSSQSPFPAPPSVLAFGRAPSPTPRPNSSRGSDKRGRDDDGGPTSAAWGPSFARRIRESDSGVFRGGGGGSCRLFGFPLVENNVGLVDDSLAEDSLVEEGIESSCSSQRANLSAKNAGHGCTRAGFLGSRSLLDMPLQVSNKSLSLSLM